MTVRHLMNAMNVLIVIVIFFMFLIVKNVVNIADRLWIGVKTMASFYNLDIETAFDKIRSGIDDGTWYFGVPIRDFLAFLVNIEGCEVIGNVHDNPELLRGDNNA